MTRRHEATVHASWRNGRAQYGGRFSFAAALRNARRQVVAIPERMIIVEFDTVDQASLFTFAA